MARAGSVHARIAFDDTDSLQFDIQGVRVSSLQCGMDMISMIQL